MENYTYQITLLKVYDELDFQVYLQYNYFMN